MKLQRLSLALAFVVLMPLLAVSCVVGARGGVVVTSAPPAARVEVIGVAPGPEFVWITGHWGWQGGNWVWVDGRWGKRPHPRAVWVAGHWKHARHGWVWLEGRWK